MWSPALNPIGLSQGDILKNVPTGSTKVPLTFLPKEPYTPKGTPPRVLYTKYDQLQEYPNDAAWAEVLLMDAADDLRARVYERFGEWLSDERIAEILAACLCHDLVCRNRDSQRVVTVNLAPQLVAKLAKE